jgi:hypothetical protein
MPGLDLQAFLQEPFGRSIARRIAESSPRSALGAARTLLESDHPLAWREALCVIIQIERTSDRMRKAEFMRGIMSRRSLGSLSDAPAPLIPRELYDETLVELVVDRVLHPDAIGWAGAALPFLADVEPFDESRFRRVLDAGEAQVPQAHGFHAIRWRSFSLLACRGPVGAVIIADSLDDDAAITRYFAAFALGAMGAEARSVLPLVDAACDDEDPQVAATARIAVMSIRKGLDITNLPPPPPERP